MAVAAVVGISGSVYRAGRLCMVVTFDEDDRSADDVVLTTVIAPTVSQPPGGLRRWRVRTAVARR
jgi:hypothetical protein